jgi:hypothetical protein
MMRRLVPSATVPLLLLALALALFGMWMHWAVLRPGNVGWLLVGDDRGESALGLAAYLRAGHWPSLREPLLDAPEGLGLLFTDSIPLLGLVLGPFAGWLPTELQFIGPWLFLCVLLQVGFAWLLVRPHAPDRLTALLATALLAAMPALFNRYGHASLCAQWLLLWALWLHSDPRRSADWRWWTAVLAVAALVHSYLLVMVASFWGAALLRLGRQRAWRGLAAVAPIPAVVVVAILGWHGAFAGGYASTHSYGAFPAALDAWWNPANPSYSALLPSSTEDHGRGFEGLNYLGAGLLALVVIGIVRRGGSGAVARGEVSALWLVPGLAVLALLAIGPQPLWRGEPLATEHLSAALIDALDPVRAAGRLVWPATYTIAYLAVTAALRRRGAAMLLGVALAVQLIDLAPMLQAVRATSAAADDPRLYRRTLDPRWATMIAGADAIEVEPAEPFRDLQLAEEIGWRAVAGCRPVRYVYAAREAGATRARINRDTAAFRAGRLDPARLYVILAGPAPRGAAVERIDGVRIIAPTRPAPAAVCISPRPGRVPSSPRSAS